MIASFSRRERRPTLREKEPKLDFDAVLPGRMRVKIYEVADFIAKPAAGSGPGKKVKKHTVLAEGVVTEKTDTAFKIESGTTITRAEMEAGSREVVLISYLGSKKAPRRK